MRIRMRGKITVYRWRVDRALAAQQIANLPHLRKPLQDIAEEVATQARALARTGTPPPKYKQQRYKGRYWSTRPDAIAKEIRVKDAGKVYRVGGVVPRNVPVMLVVADHPFSRHYEYGIDGFRATRMFTMAVAQVRRRRGGKHRRQGGRR